MKRIFLLFSFSLMAVFAGAEDSYLLQAKYPWGKKVIKLHSTYQHQEMKSPNQLTPAKTIIKQEQEFEISYKKEEDSSGVLFKCISFKLDFNSNNKRFSFDSSDRKTTAPKHPAADVSKLVGVPLRFELNDKEQVISSSGLEALKNKFSQNNVAMAQVFNVEYFKQIFGPGLAQAFPAEAQKVGASWKFKKVLSLPMLGQVTVELKYKLEGIEERMGHSCCIISYTGVMSADGASKTGLQNMKMKSGEIKGRIFFDPVLGLDLDQELEQEFIMALDLPPSPNAKDPKTVDIVSFMTAQYSVLQISEIK